MAYWLFKSEPGTYSIDDLRRDKRTSWDGIRNYQVRNMLRDDVRRGDSLLFYHSSCPEPGVTGIAEVISEGYPDHTVYKGKGNTDPDNPTWYMVDVAFRRKLKRTIPLTEIRAAAGLGDLPLLARGNRLSIMPLSKQQWDRILRLE